MENNTNKKRKTKSQPRISFPVPKEIVAELINLYATLPEPKCGCCIDNDFEKTINCSECNKTYFICNSCDIEYTKRQYSCSCCKGFICRFCRPNLNLARCDIHELIHTSRKRCYNDVIYCTKCSSKLRTCKYCEQHLYLCNSRFIDTKDHFDSITDYEYWMQQHELNCSKGEIYILLIKKNVSYSKLPN